MNWVSNSEELKRTRGSFLLFPYWVLDPILARLRKGPAYAFGAG